MSQLGKGVRTDHTYSMDWSKQYSSNQKKRYMCKCNCYNCLKVQSREQVPGMDKATQTESLPYEYYLEDWRGPGDNDNEIETEEHKVCVMPDVASQMDLKEKDEYLDNTQGYTLKCENEIVSQDSCVPEKNYMCQDLIRPCYIKDEVAPETNYVLQGCGMNYNFQQPSSICAEGQLCPCGVCGEVKSCNYWFQERMQIDAEVQADAFECEDTIKCIKCGVVIQDRSCCVKQYLLSVYECSACVAHATRGPVMTSTSYFQPITQLDATANLKTVPCDYCNRTFASTKGMRIHAGRLHKGIMVKN